MFILHYFKKDMYMKKKMLFTCVLLSSVGLAFAKDDKAVTKADAKTMPAKKTELDPSNVLYVDMQQAMLQSKQGAEAQKIVEAEEKKYAELAQKEQQKMMKLKADTDAKASMMTADARRKKEKELADMQRDFQNNMQDWKYELQYTMQRETDAMVKDIEQAAISLAKNNDKAAVIDATTGRALYLRDDVNSTNQLVNVLDEQYTLKLAQQKNDKKAAITA